MDTHASLHNGVLQHWKSARTTLSHAINNYLAASVGLCHLLSSSARHASLCHLLEQTLSGIDLELLSLQSEEERLKQTRITLANERNKSGVLNLACKLPPEILATIFVIATSQYMRRDRTASSRSHTSPIVLSSVSSSWRRIALTTPSLWSYIDLIIGNESTPSHRKQAELWVQRSCNATLYVDIFEKGSSSDREPVPKHQIAGLLEFLAPLMHRVCALNFGARVAMHDVLPSVLALWAKHTSTEMKRALEVADHFGGPDAILGRPAADGSFSADELNSFLRSFNRITVLNCRISESVMFHEGLVELHLQGLEYSNAPTQQELVAMLVTCPRLRILVLVDCLVNPSEAIPSPVSLNHLEFLSLESAGASRNFVHVFPLLSIGSEGLSMSLTLDNYCDFFDEARAFFSRTKVTRLHVWAIQGHIPLSMLSYPIPHLETLALDSFDMSNDEVYSMVLWPRLRTLYLKDPVISGDGFQQLVQLHRSLKTLHVYRPMTEGQSEISMTDDECAHLAESMQIVEDFQIERQDWGSRTIATWDFVILDIW